MIVINVEAVIRFEYIFNFIIPIICVLILGIILFLPKKSYINDKNNKLGKRKPTYYLKSNDVENYKDLHEISKLEKQDSELNQRKQKKYKTIYILILRIIYILAYSFALITYWVPLALDIPAALNKDYQTYEVRLMHNVIGHDIETRNGRPMLISIEVQDIESGEVFDFRTGDAPGLNLYKGDIITIYILPNSRIGGYSI